MTAFALHEAVERVAIDATELLLRLRPRAAQPDPIRSKCADLALSLALLTPVLDEEEGKE